MEEAQLGVILPHEHIFVDLGPIEAESYRYADTAEVVRLMQPELEKIKAQGVTALVECTPVGVGRRADIVRAVSEAVSLPVVVPTGIYREPWIPQWAHEASEETLAAWMLGELRGKIESSGVQAAWIKLSAGDEGMTSCEAKILRAAAAAGAGTGAAIGSHTVRGRVVRDQLDVLEAAGYNASRFIWIHTQAEPDFALHLEVAERGGWLEYDSIGSDQPGDEKLIAWIIALLEAGFGHQLLLSHDRGWYDPSKPGGGAPKPYTYLFETFLPKLRAAGLNEATLMTLTCFNPFHAFAR